MRVAGPIVVLLLAWGYPSLHAHAAPHVSPAAQTRVATPRILVAGVPVDAPDVQKIISQAWRQAVADAGPSTHLSQTQWQGIIDAVNAALHQAGHADARAYLSSQLAVFSVSTDGTVVAATGAPSAPAEASTQVLPPVSQRDADTGSGPRVATRGFVVKGVGQHPEVGITPDSIQKMAAAQLVKFGGSAAHPAQLNFDQLQGVADAITQRYRKAGFIVATAFLPAQDIGDDDLVRIKVLEGRIGQIVVKGTDHYRPWVIAAPAQKLRGKVLRKRDVETALLYDRDLPGVSVSSTFQPGEKTGQTDLIMIAREDKRPYEFTVGASNYGTETTGRYRAEARLDWNSPLGIGDRLSVGVNYSLNPHQNTYGSLTYSIPVPAVPGFGFMLGADRSELELDKGAFAALDVHGPTSRYFGGMQWKFVNNRDLSMTGSLQYIHEESSLSSLGFQLSDERFNVAQLGFSMRHTGRASHGIDLLSVSLRKALDDMSRQPDLVSPGHAGDFMATRLGYTRIQFLNPTQRLFFKFSGQYSEDALVPMEQFAIGGPDSVRAYPIADSLVDRGYYGALEYHIDAPGFADTPSPFNGVPWREVLTLEAFVDYARGYSVGANRRNDGNTVIYHSAGVGLIFRLPHWNDLLFHLDVAVPTGGRDPADGSNYHVYGRFDMTF